ncbi:MAG: hypothetical protein ACOYZ8_00110, partial [Chloroflexota bacterium]
MSNSAPKEDIQRIIASAQRLGVELDEADAFQWLTAMSTIQSDGGIIVNERVGIFGHKVSMLDFSEADLDHFRRLGRLVEFVDMPGRVETALALSGSAAQSKIQTYPGDADYFERVNILAPSREAACQTLADLIREKVSTTLKGPNYLMIEAKFGSYPMDVMRGGKLKKKGDSISW